VDPYRLSLSVTHADGSITPLSAPIERTDDAGRVLQEIGFSTVAPGGFGDLNGKLARDIALGGLGELSRFDTLRAYGAGNRTAFEGYAIGFPASKGDETSIGIESVGWAAHLSDYEDLCVVFVTRATDAWGEPTLNQRLQILDGDKELGTDFEATVEQLALGFQGHTQKVVNVGSRAVLMAVAPGATKWTGFQYKGTSGGATTKVDAPTLYHTDDDTLDFGSWNFNALTLDNTLQKVAPNNANKFMMLQMRKSGAAETMGTPPRFHYKDVALFGSDLTLRAIAGEQDGLWASDMIAWALQNGAPLLVFTQVADVGAADATIADSDEFVVPEADYRDGATAQEILEGVNAYHAWDYLVWEGRRFYYQPTSKETRVWRARTDRGAKLSLQGPDAANQWTAVAVYYQTPNGETRVVGPPSRAALCTSTDPVLEITDETNDLVAHGRSRVKRLNLEFPTTLAGATEIGSVWLEETQELEEQGDVNITGEVEDDDGNLMPTWMVRASERIVVEDVSSKERRIVDTNYTGQDRAVQAALDSPPHRIEAYLERLNARTLRTGA
jgi:hypothetical protein